MMDGRRGALEFQFQLPIARSAAAVAAEGATHLNELLLLDEDRNEHTIFKAG
jgi:hypothetical protein